MDIIKKLSEPLSIEDIDFRVQSISKKGFCTILAYKDARVDMNRLDEVCGVYWQDKYELIDGQLFCHIGIYDKEIQQWVWRSDVGTESFTEEVKGRASDAFKRAGFRWGIGRELYSYPRIQTMLLPNEFYIDGQKVKQGFDFQLREWKWELKRNGDIIEYLTAHDEKGRLRYDSRKDFNSAPTVPVPQLDVLKELMSCKTRADVNELWKKLSASDQKKYEVQVKTQLKKIEDGNV